MVVGTGGGVVADSTGLPARPVAHARHRAGSGRDGAPVVDDDGHARQGRAAALRLLLVVAVAGAEAESCCGSNTSHRSNMHLVLWLDVHRGPEVDLCS